MDRRHRFRSRRSDSFLRLRFGGCFAGKASTATVRLLSATYLPRNVSLIPPMALRTFPAALSALPSLSNLASPVTLPATPFSLPLACCAEPLIRSLSICVFLFWVRVGNKRHGGCLLYTSDAADDLLCVDLGG